MVVFNTRLMQWQMLVMIFVLKTFFTVSLLSLYRSYVARAYTESVVKTQGDKNE